MYKAIENNTYSHLNQLTEVDFGTKKTVYTYMATGAKLKTEIYEGTILKSTTEYCGAFVYEDNKLSYINITGGQIVNCQLSIVNYEYNLTDHLGNVRVTFKDSSGTAVIVQEDHYYPFGMRMNGMHFTNTDLINKYLYNGKEQQEQTNYYDYGFRQMDPQLGRWHVVDALAESYFSTSSYAYVENNPISRYDVAGLYSGPNPYPSKIKYHHRGGDDFDFIYRDNGLNNIMGLSTAHHYNPRRNIGGSFENYWSQENGEWVYTGYRHGNTGHFETILKSYHHGIKKYGYTGKSLKAWLESNFDWVKKWVWDDEETGNDVDGVDGVPFGGRMFYTEDGEWLYSTHEGDENIIYTIKDEKLKKFDDLLKEKFGDSYLIHYAYDRKLVDSRWSIFEPKSINDNSVFAFRARTDIPWYIYAATIIHTLGEGFYSGYSKHGTHIGMQESYHIWDGYFGIHKFKPWW